MVAKQAVSFMVDLYLGVGGTQRATLYQWSLSMSGPQLQELHQSF